MSLEKNTRFIELAGEINTTMPDYVVSKVADALNDEGKALKGSKDSGSWFGIQGKCG